MARLHIAAGALVSAASLIFSCTANGAIIYRETFGRPDPAAGNVGTVEFDWARWATAGTTGSTTSGVSSDGVGKPTDLANINAGNNIDGTTNAYAEGWSYQDGTLRLSATNEYTVDVASYTPGSIVFSWYQGAAQISSVDQVVKLAVQVGGAWYVSATGLTNPPVTSGGNFGSTDPLVQGGVLVSKTYDPAAANWVTLVFDGSYDTATNVQTAATAPLAVGAAPASDLSGSITAFGLYRDTTGANLRFDSFTIEAVPEPASLALGLLGACGVRGFSRRRRGA